VAQHVLIVEDQDDGREMLRQLLAVTLGLEVDAAENGSVALEMLERRPSSVIVSDLMMSRLNGLQLLEENLSRQWPVTVMMTTGHGSITDAVRAGSP
jgi:DNA-binding NtrC family response regulator